MEWMSNAQNGRFDSTQSRCTMFAQQRADTIQDDAMAAHVYSTRIDKWGAVIINRYSNANRSLNASKSKEFTMKMPDKNIFVKKKWYSLSFDFYFNYKNNTIWRICYGRIYSEIFFFWISALMQQTDRDKERGRERGGVRLGEFWMLENESMPYVRVVGGCRAFKWK